MIPPDQSGAFVAAMEEVLDVYKRPYNPENPVVCIDEMPKQLIQENRGLTADIRGRNVQVLKGYSNMQEPEVQQVPFMEQIWE